MRSIVIALTLVLFGLSLVWAAAPDTLWTRTFGGPSFEWPWYVEETSDSGLVITGYTGSTTYGDRDIYIVKLRQDGSLAWDEIYGVEKCADEAGSAKETRDGGLIVAGYGSGQFGDEGANFYLMKLDSLGNVLWDEDYDYDTTTDYGYDVCETLDGGYIIAGTTFSSAGGSYAWLRKVGEEQTGTAKTPVANPTEETSPTITLTVSPTQNMADIQAEDPTEKPPEAAVGFEAVLAITVSLSVYIIGRRRW